MKRLLALGLGICMTALCLTACGDQPDNDAADSNTVTLYDGSVIDLIDDGSEINETENGYQWVFLEGEYSMTFPLSWQSRFLIRGTTVYCRACFERGILSSTLFNIELRQAEDVANEPVPAAILGISGRDYVCAVYPRLVEPSNTVLRKEFDEMLADCDGILKKAAAKETNPLLPISTEGYRSADNTARSELFGKWKLQSKASGKQDETVTFRRDDGKIVFTSGENVLVGSCLYNIYTSTYDSSMQSNWGDAALVFLDGKLYYATYYETEPRTLSFKTAVIPPKQIDLLKGTVFETDQ